MQKLRLLDLYCGAGGAAMGYYRAGFEVVGVDILPQPHYPFEFYQADALEYSLKGFDVVHASPPCQCFTKYKNVHSRRHACESYPNLIPQTRQRLKESDLLYVIENVVGSPLLNPVILCGSMFGLDVRRHRLFESNAALVSLQCDHSIWKPNRYPGGRSRERGGPRVLVRATVEIGRWNIALDTQQAAMGIDWTNLEELSEAVPPAYTEYLGEQLIAIIAAGKQQY